MLEILIPLLSLIALEFILGIDNMIFISILADKLPGSQRNKILFWGIGLAMIMRLVLLAFITWILKLDKTLFSLFEIDFTGEGLIVITVVLFLIYDSTEEIYHNTEVVNSNESFLNKKDAFRKILGKIIILVLVFSIGSIITAVGMVNELWIMYTSVIFCVIIMLFALKPMIVLISKHPSFKVLALCFLMMIGVPLLAEGFQFKIPKAYIYFTMAFVFLVNVFQMKTNVVKPKN